MKHILSLALLVLTYAAPTTMLAMSNNDDHFGYKDFFKNHTDQETVDLFWHAIYNNETAALETLFKKIDNRYMRINVNMIDDEWRTPLYYARVTHKNSAMEKLLQKYGAIDPYKTMSHGIKKQHKMEQLIPQLTKEIMPSDQPIVIEENADHKNSKSQQLANMQNFLSSTREQSQLASPSQQSENEQAISLASLIDLKNDLQTSSDIDSQMNDKEIEAQKIMFAFYESQKQRAQTLTALDLPFPIQRSNMIDDLILADEIFGPTIASQDPNQVPTEELASNFNFDDKDLDKL